MKTSLCRIALIFSAQYLLLVALVFAIIWAIEAFFDLPFENNVMGLIIPFAASMTAGNNYYNRAGAKPTGSFSWLVALVCGVLSVALTGLVLFAAYRLGTLPEVDELMRDPDRVMIVTVISAGMGLLFVLICRLGFGMGVRQAVKLKEKQQAKAG